MTESMATGQEAPVLLRTAERRERSGGPALHSRVGKEGDDISQVTDVIPSPTDKGVVATSATLADFGRLTRFG